MILVYMILFGLCLLIGYVLLKDNHTTEYWGITTVVFILFLFLIDNYFMVREATPFFCSLFSLSGLLTALLLNKLK